MRQFATNRPRFSPPSPHRDSGIDPTSLHGVRSELLTLADEMDDIAARCIQLWLDHAVDPQGGVYGHLDRRWRPVFDEEGKPRGASGEHRGDKSLIQVARHLYSYSLMARRRGRTRTLEKACHSCFDLLKGSFRRSDESPLLHQLNRYNAPRDDQVQLYAQSFAIFGLSAYARAFDDDQAGSLAVRLFEIVDEQRHDAKNGGYDQWDDGGWLPYVNAPPGASRCTNTHIHVLEALTELSHWAPSHERVVARLQELSHLLATCMTQPEGYVAKFFDDSWQPVGRVEVSYGHDIETSWLLRDAADRLVELGHGETQLLAHDAANRMARHALAAGWDPAGGLFDSGAPLSAQVPGASLDGITVMEKIWWAQAEALPGIYSLYRATADQDVLPQLHQTFAFARTKSLDPVHGEFYFGVDSDGTVGPRGDHKGEIWKTPYHAVRALTLTADWIREDWVE